MTLSSGARLGPYEILSPLGAGGMGEVYRARDPRLGREVAIKVLPSSFSADADRLRRFEQEAKAAGILNHPNITAVYDIGTHEGAPYVVQELLEGETLRSILAGGRLSPRKAVDYGLQVSHGLAAAHEKGIVHRDLKPENLFVTRDGRVKILDFGLAKLTHAEEGGALQTSLPTATAGTEPGVVLGTLGYMSPEQVRGKQADARSDIFSFGSILYEMLSGKRAFHGDSAADTMSAILREDPPDLSLTNQSISPGLDRIVRHCLEKNPEQRFQSARDLAFDLEAQSGLSGAVAAVPTARPAPRVAKSHLILLAAVALIVGGLLAHFLFRPRAPQPPTFRRLTFRRGNIVTARFSPDGQTVFYGAAWGGNPLEIFSTRIGSPESTPLGIRNADLFAVSSAGELAVSLRQRFLSAGGVGTLARVPVGGGAPRPVLDFVDYADWSPDGKNLAVVRLVNGRHRIEYPIERVLYSSAQNIRFLHVSRSGDQIAFVEDGPEGPNVEVVGIHEKAKTLSGPWSSVIGVAWAPSGREIWFGATSREGEKALHAVDLAGRERLLLRSPDTVILDDVTRDGRILLERFTTVFGVVGRAPGDSADREFSWFDGTRVADISPDGRMLLLGDRADSGREGGAIYLRPTDGSAPLRLGEGFSSRLSPDGKRVIAWTPGRPPVLQLLPTGTGNPRPIPVAPLEPLPGVAWLPDGKRFLFGARTGEKSQIFLGDLEGGKPRPIAPEGFATTGNPVSPDGRWVVVFRDWSEDLSLQAIDGGERRTIPDSAKFDPIQWNPDGRSLFVQEIGGVSARIFRLDPFTGRRELWKELTPPDPGSVISVSDAVLTPDGRAWAYGYRRVLSSDLFLVEGLR